jgi:hypothetical protein
VSNYYSYQRYKTKKSSPKKSIDNAPAPVPIPVDSIKDLSIYTLADLDKKELRPLIEKELKYLKIPFTPHKDITVPPEPTPPIRYKKLVREMLDSLEDFDPWDNYEMQEATSTMTTYLLDFWSNKDKYDKEYEKDLRQCKMEQAQREKTLGLVATQQKEFAKIKKDYARIRGSIVNKIDFARGQVKLIQTAAPKYTEYLDLANGDSDIAMRFLKKEYPDVSKIENFKKYVLADVLERANK